MADIIDLLIAVDAELLIAAYPNLSQNYRKPTTIDASYCYLLGAPTLVAAGLASDALTFAPFEGDAIAPATIRWRSVSLSGNSDAAAVVYSITIPPGRKTVATPRERACTRVVPVLANGAQTDPPSFDTVPGDDYFLDMGLRGSGKLAVLVHIYLTEQDPQSGEPVLKGYAQWPGTLVLP